MKIKASGNFWILLSALLLFSYFCVNALGQAAAHPQLITESDGKIRISVNDPRPLDLALNALQQKYGWRVNYEEPQYTSKLDLADPKSTPDGRVQPNGGSFVVEFASPAGAELDEQKTLQLIVDAYNKSSNPGRFELRHNGEQYDIVGTSAHDSQGKISPQQISLDLPVMIPSEDRTVADAVDAVCQKVSDKTHVAITLGVHPGGLDRQRATVGGKEMPARAYITAATEPTGRKISWRLLYDPDSKTYVLNLHQTRTPPPPKAPAPVPTNPSKP